MASLEDSQSAEARRAADNSGSYQRINGAEPRSYQRSISARTINTSVPLEHIDTPVAQRQSDSGSGPRPASKQPVSKRRAQNRLDAVDEKFSLLHFDLEEGSDYSEPEFPIKKPLASVSSPKFSLIEELLVSTLTSKLAHIALPSHWLWLSPTL